jgi:hypothetical protein
VSSSDDVHIVRPDSPRQPGKTEVLCGYEAPKGGNRVAGPPSMATCWQCILLACGRPIPPEPLVPEHERLAEAKKTDDATTLVGQFFDWLKEEKHYVIAKYADDADELMPIFEPVNRLLAEFFGINENALESEKRALLDHMRAVTGARAWALKEGKAALASK